MSQSDTLLGRIMADTWTEADRAKLPKRTRDRIFQGILEKFTEMVLPGLPKSQQCQVFLALKKAHWLRMSVEMDDFCRRGWLFGRPAN
jgi:hypothetical protein